MLRKLRGFWFLWALLAAAAFSVAAIAHAAPALIYGTSTTDNMMRPCSYRGKTSTNVSISATSAATASALETGRVIRVVCDTTVHFRTASTSPTAVATDTLLPANTIEWFVSEGDYFAAIRDSANGTCYLTVCR